MKKIVVYALIMCFLLNFGISAYASDIIELEEIGEDAENQTNPSSNVQEQYIPDSNKTQNQQPAQQSTTNTNPAPRPAVTTQPVPQTTAMSLTDHV